jgi:hypothetical protein
MPVSPSLLKQQVAPVVGGDKFACAYDLSSDGSGNAGSGDGGGGSGGLAAVQRGSGPQRGSARGLMLFSARARPAALQPRVMWRPRGSSWGSSPKQQTNFSVLHSSSLAAWSA